MIYIHFICFMSWCSSNIYNSFLFSCICMLFHYIHFDLCNKYIRIKCAVGFRSFSFSFLFAFLNYSRMIIEAKSPKEERLFFLLVQSMCCYSIHSFQLTFSLMLKLNGYFEKVIMYAAVCQLIDSLERHSTWMLRFIGDYSTPTRYLWLEWYDHRHQRELIETTDDN